MLSGLSNYNLNLTASYVASWGAWEIVREFLCNAVDSGTHFDYTIKSGYCRVRSKGSIDLHNLILIGAGTKDAETGTIGQFGEGAKMAALAAVRDGGSVSLRTKDQHISFAFMRAKEFPKAPETLHALIVDRTEGTSDSEWWEGDWHHGLEVIIQHPGINQGLQNYLMPGVLATGKIPESVSWYDGGTHKECGKLYCKGVYIMDAPNSLFDHNINTMKINRDRNASLGTSEDVFPTSQFYTWSSVMWTLFLKRGKASWETDLLKERIGYGGMEDFATYVKKQFLSVFGPDAVYRSPYAAGTVEQHEEQARSRNQVLVSPEFRIWCIAMALKLPDSEIKVRAIEPGDFTEIAMPKTVAPVMEWMQRMYGHDTEIKIFEDTPDHDPIYVSDKTVWVAQRLCWFRDTDAMKRAKSVQDILQGLIQTQQGAQVNIQSMGSVAARMLMHAYDSQQ